MNRPELVLLIGIPGSGKTYFAEKYVKNHDNYIHLSSDKIRKELYGDESIQQDHEKVFGLMRQRALEALERGESVVYDSTAMTRKDRASIISVIPKYVMTRAVVIWAPIEICIERDVTRDRTVGKEVIDKMLKRFQFPYWDEGFHNIEVYNSTRYPEFNSNKYERKTLRDMNIPHDNSHHTLDIIEHCNKAAAYIGYENYSPLFEAAQWHDCGKPYCKDFHNTKGELTEEAHFYGHQCISAWIACGIYYGHEDVVEVCWLISTHMEPFFNNKYYNKLPPFLKEKIDLLHEADLQAH